MDNPQILSSKDATWAGHHASLMQGSPNHLNRGSALLSLLSLWELGESWLFGSAIPGISLSTCSPHPLGEPETPVRHSPSHRQVAPKLDSGPCLGLRKSQSCQTPWDGRWNSSLHSLLDSSCCYSHKDWHHASFPLLSAKLPAWHISIFGAL